MAKAQLAPPSSPYRYQYAAKFICETEIPGTNQRAEGLVRGHYETSVNIHNPGTNTAKIRTKLASPYGISQWIEGALEYDEVMQINCRDRRRYSLPPAGGFEGFLVIESLESLDVVAVYTATAAHPSPHAPSIDVERVPERELHPQ